MALNCEEQKTIYDFLVAVSESIDGFRGEHFAFLCNEALANDTLLDSDAELDTSARLDKASRLDAGADNQAIGSFGGGLRPADTSAKLDNKNLTTGGATFKGFVIESGKAGPLLNDEELWKLSQIQYEVQNCQACKLCESRNLPVVGEGCFTFAGEDEPKTRPLVMVIGEAPGQDENRMGRPFVGRAGQLLDRMLAAIGLSRQTNCYICNIVKCRPPDNREPEPLEVQSCLDYLRRQVQIIRPSYILLLGRTAAHAILDTAYGMKALHGNWFNISGIPTMCTYHPSALLRDEMLKIPTWEDLQRFKQGIGE